MTSTTYSWERYWAPLGTSLDRGWHGEWFFRPVGSAYPTTSHLLEDRRFLVLLGNPGTGKSTELEKLEQVVRDEDNPSTVLRLRATSLGIQATSFISNTQAWRLLQENDQALTLLIDGIDEALAAHPHLMDELMEFANLHNHPKLRFVFCLRSGAWDGRRYASVFKTWETTPEQCVFELCQLRVEDVRVSFNTAELGDPKAFLEWLREKDLGPTARIAQFLQPLIDAWSAGEDQTLSVHQLRDRQITRLLQEDPSRTNPPAIAIAKLESLSELIAVHALLSGTMQFSFTGESSDGSVNMGLSQFLEPPLGGTWKYNETEFEFGQTELEHLLNRPLFRRISSVNQPPSFAFEHHSFAERLAARCFTRQPVEHLLQILCTPEGTRIAPQMEALAAALAPSNRHLAEWLRERQPEILLRSDGSAYEPGFRAIIVKATLHHIDASDENQRLESSQIDSGFACKEVAEVLIPFIESTNFKSLTRRSALLIAERCPDEALSAPLLAMFDAESHEKYLRSAALNAWLAFTRRSVDFHSETIWEIARGSRGTNRAHDRADALRVLLSAGVPAKEIIAKIPNSDESLIGSLQMLLDYELPKFVTVDDLSACFDYLGRVGPSRNGQIPEEKLPDIVYRLALQNLSNPDIVRRFADHWWVVERKFHAYLEEHFRSLLEDAPAQSRHSLIATLLDSPERPAPLYIWHFPLYDGDLEWLISSLPTEGDPRRPIWLMIVKHRWPSLTENGVPDWLTEAYNAGTADFREIFPTPTNGRTLSETISRWKRAGQLQLERRHRHLKTRHKKPKQWTRPEFTTFVQDEFTRDPVSGWVRFVDGAWATMSGNEKCGEKWESPIVNSPGWRALPKAGCQSAKQAARDFLISERSSQAPLVQTSWTNAAYYAIDFLEADIAGDHELRSAIKEKWIGAVLSHFNNGEECHQQLVAIAKSIAPDRVRTLMISSVRRRLENQDWHLKLRAFMKSWDSDDSIALSDLMHSLLVSSSRRRTDIRLPKKSSARRRAAYDDEFTKSRGFISAFHRLADVDPKIAKQLSAKLTKQRVILGDEPHGTVPVLLIHALLLFPETWSDIWPKITRYSQITLQRVFNQLLPRLDRGEYFKDGWLTNLAPKNLNKLYLLYCSIFGDVPTEAYSNKNGHVTRHDYRYDFERAIWNHLSDLGAVGEIQLLLGTMSGDNRRNSLRWHLRDARRMEAQSAWTPPNMLVISKWLITNDAVLVRNDTDLKEAILASLARYQEHQHSSGLVVPDCWERVDQTSFRPSYEEDLSLKIDHHLSIDLNRVIVTREAEIRIGTRKGRTDIEVSTVVKGCPLTIVIEHKRAHNREVPTAMSGQLVKRYLKPKALTTGIYLISWFDGYSKSDKPCSNSLNVSSIEEAESLLQTEAETLRSSEGVDVGIFVLNCVPSEFQS